MFNRDKQDALIKEINLIKRKISKVGEDFNCEDNTLDIITDLSNLHDNICSQ